MIRFLGLTRDLFLPMIFLISFWTITPTLKIFTIQKQFNIKFSYLMEVCNTKQISVGHTIPTFSCRLTYHLSDQSQIRLHVT